MPSSLDSGIPDGALGGGSNRLFQLPRFVPQAAGFRRAPVPIKGTESGALVGSEVLRVREEGAEGAADMGVDDSL